VPNRIKFGNHLFCSGDYIRAVDEYREVLTKKNNDTVRFKLSLSLNEIGKYSEAEDNLKSLFVASSLINEAKLEYYKTLYLRNDFNLFREELRNPVYLPDKYLRDIYKLKSITYLYPGQALPDSSAFFKPFNEYESKELLKFYLRKKYPDYKSAATAALLSAVVPGLGKIYTGKYTDGITSFLLTGVLTYLSIDNFNADHQVRAWLFAGLAAYFYAGNIYGSAASAQIYNAGIKFNFENDLKFYLNKNNNLMPGYDFLCN